MAVAMRRTADEGINLLAYRCLPSASSLQDPISAPMARTRTQICAAGGSLSITQSRFFVAKPSAGNQSEDCAFSDSGSSLYCARNAAAPCGRDHLTIAEPDSLP